MSEMTVAEVLEGAADRVANGWCQGVYYYDGCFCVLGAIADACNEDAMKISFFERLPGEATHQLRGVTGAFVLQAWNDAPDRTQAEVVAKLREAAAVARGNA